MLSKVYLKYRVEKTIYCQPYVQVDDDWPRGRQPRSIAFSLKFQGFGSPLIFGGVAVSRPPPVLAGVVAGFTRRRICHGLS